MDEGGEQGVAKSHGRKSVLWKRDPVIMARLRQVERLHLRGDTNVAIAEALSVGEVTVRRDLDRLRELWIEQIQRDQADLRAQVVAELDDTRYRALAAAEFDEACERAVLFGEGDREVERDAKGSAQFRGNKAASLAQARQATMDKAKVLGLIVDKVAPTDKNGEDLPLSELMERFAQRAGSADGGEGGG